MNYPNPQEIRRTRNEWLRRAMSTGPDDIELRDRSLAMVYRSCACAPPREVVNVGSPSAALMERLDRFESCDFRILGFGFRSVCDRVRDYFNENSWELIHSDAHIDGDLCNMSYNLKIEISHEIYIEKQGFLSEKEHSHEDLKWMSSYYVFRDYFPELSAMDGIFNLIMSTGWVWLMRDIVILAARPTELHFSADGELHCDGGPAVAYPDGFRLYRLNGVRVPEWLACGRRDLIEPQLMLGLTNAEQRREFVRKVGIEKILRHFKAQIVESSGLYELLKLDLGDGRLRPYLRMQNPSVDSIHVEGVPVGCLTIQEALNYRNGLTADQIDEINGSEWFQQGDVILRPRGAVKFKSRPKILT